MAIQTKAEISKALQKIGQQISITVNQLSDDEFNRIDGESWSASGYLKHLILSVKPFARSLALPKDKLEGLFGTSDAGSITYDQLVKKYNGALDAGIRAEDMPNVVPVNYRFPEGVEDDIQGYLVDTWDGACEDLLSALGQWSEGDLDRYVLPHPAIGKITMREMCFFTIHHNTMHHEDIQQVALA